MRFIQLSAIAFILFFTSSCINKATKYYNRGLQKFDMEEFEFAAEDMKQALAYGASKKATNYYIAESYRLSNRIHDAEKFYAAAIEEGVRNQHAHFYYAFALKANGNYEGAKNALKHYVKVGTKPDYLDRARHEIKNLKELEVLAYKKRFYEVTNFEELNTVGVEYSPMMLGKDLYFTSSRGEGPMFPGQGTRFTDIYRWRFDGITQHSGIASNNELTAINIPHIHEATATFSPDGKTMVYSRSNSGKKNDITQEVDLFISEYVAGFWSEPKRLSISNTNSWDSNPCFSADGSMLYFSSNRRGGLGGDDIWFAIKNIDGEWDNVQNVGRPINTEANEQFPYERSDGRFYFSSNGHPGYGELDVYEVLVTSDGDQVVRNLGKPLNGNHDDFSITFSSNETGYFSSNRPTGKGNDDIYYFDFNNIVENECCLTLDSCCPIKLILTGEVFGKKLDGEKITNEEILLPFSSVTLSDTLGNVLATTTADSSGKFTFNLKAEENYLLKASQTGYVTREIKYSTVGQSKTKEELDFVDDDISLKTKIVLDPITKGLVLEFPPIYYDYNSAKIRTDASSVLKLMAKVLNDNPTIIVEIGSHTDSRSSEEYNKTLSQKRAQSAVDYIISLGIAKNRLVATGYGESTPRTMNKEIQGFTKGTVLTEEYVSSLKDEKQIEACHQLNRRTEFKIVGELKNDELKKAIENK